MIAPMMGVVFWISFMWRPMTVAGAWATTLTGFATWWISTQPWFIAWIGELPSSESLRLLWEDGEKTVVYLPWQILFYRISASTVGIIVSLFAPRVSEERLSRFYQRSRTSVDPNEQIEQPCTLPAARPVADRRMLATAWGLEIPMPSRVSLVGFANAWFLVALIIGDFIWIVN